MCSNNTRTNRNSCKLTQPTFIIVGTNDAPLQDPLMKSIGILIQKRDAGHGLMYQYPTEFNRVLIIFLENSHEHFSNWTDSNNSIHRYFLSILFLNSSLSCISSFHSLACSMNVSALIRRNTKSSRSNINLHFSGSEEGSLQNSR